MGWWCLRRSGFYRLTAVLASASLSYRSSGLGRFLGKGEGLEVWGLRFGSLRHEYSPADFQGFAQRAVPDLSDIGGDLQILQDTY